MYVCTYKQLVTKQQVDFLLDLVVVFEIPGLEGFMEVFQADIHVRLIQTTIKVVTTHSQMDPLAVGRPLNPRIQLRQIVGRVRAPDSVLVLLREHKPAFVITGVMLDTSGSGHANVEHTKLVFLSWTYACEMIRHVSGSQTLSSSSCSL